MFQDQATQKGNQQNLDEIALLQTTVDNNEQEFRKIEKVWVIQIQGILRCFCCLNLFFCR